MHGSRATEAARKRARVMRGATCGVILCAAAALLAQAITLHELLFRANEAIIEYERSFSNVVAEEHYVQRIVRHDGRVRRERTLRSDLLLILLPGAESWLGFRDVFEVDGKPVRDRRMRLQRLFLDGSASGIGQATRIAQESARYNIGKVRRTVNLPLVALGFLHPLTQHRFRFQKLREEAIRGRRTWVIRYSEHLQPTIVQTPFGDMFAHGTFWLDVDTGRAARSLLILGDGASQVRTSITVDYRPDDRIGVWVPDTMTERYETPQMPHADRIDATATYSNFRRFGVQIDEAIGVP